MSRNHSQKYISQIQSCVCENILLAIIKRKLSENIYW